jgi:hypothetical protein
MKIKITFLLFFSTIVMLAQQKTTNIVTLGATMGASITLDSTTSQATLTLTGPNDRWFALQFGSFSGGMETGTDVVYYSGTTLVDARHNGVGMSPTDDNTNHWVVVSNNDNTPTTGLRTIVASRAFNTGDTSDFTFNYADTSIDMAWAHYSSALYTLAYHGFANRGVSLDVPLSVLSNENFTINSVAVYPNPSKGFFTISSKAILTEVLIYDINGKFIKTFKNHDNAENLEVNILDLPVGFYMLEIKNDTETTWKKILKE